MQTSYRKTFANRMQIAQFFCLFVVQPSETKKHMNYLIDKKRIV